MGNFRHEYLAPKDKEIIAMALEGRSAKYIANVLETGGFPVNDFSDINTRLRYLGIDRPKVMSDKTVLSNTKAKRSIGMRMANSGNSYRGCLGKSMPF